MITRTIRFQRVMRKQTCSGKCDLCGKKTRRVFKAEQTVNPWNRNPDGSAKTYEEVCVAVIEELRRICELPICCTTCSPYAPYNTEVSE